MPRNIACLRLDVGARNRQQHDKNGRQDFGGGLIHPVRPDVAG
jgi:hypothetical protein